MERVIKKDEEVIELALEAGKLALENGAEIFRVEEIIEHICTYYHIQSAEAFVLSNGIFMTAGDLQEEVFAKVKHIPVSAAHLDTVAKVNALSRDITSGKYTLESAKEELEKIKNMPHYSPFLYILASGFGSAGFCYMFGGTIAESLVAFLAGLTLYFFIIFVFHPQMSKIVTNMIGAFIVTTICGLCFQYHFIHQLNYTVIGSIMPLIPGVAFINGIREISNGDYISGFVRIMDAIVIFISIAIGVGFAINFLNFIYGGFIL